MDNRNLKKYAWRGALIVLPLVVIILELIAIYDGNPNTETYTKLITAYIPSNLFYLLLGAAGVWTLAHFLKYYKS